MQRHDLRVGIVVGVLIALVLVGLVVLLGFVLVNDQRRENEKRRATRKLLRENDDT